MFASTEQDASAIGTTVDSWYSEYTQYPFSNPPQTMAEAWGHFSQLVWKGTSTVGCANYYCDTLNDPSGNAMAGLHSFIVCNYQNPGKHLSIPLHNRILMENFQETMTASSLRTFRRLMVEIMQVYSNKGKGFHFLLSKFLDRHHCGGPYFSSSKRCRVHQVETDTESRQ